MAKYRVCFDGKWQHGFANLDDALAWGRQVGETGRMVHVVRQRLIRAELIAVFPEARLEEGRRLWKVRAEGVGFGGGKIW